MLMASSSVPILAVDPGLDKPLPDKPRILMADDLSDDAEAALAFAADLTTASHGGLLHHLHVNGITEDALRAALATAAATAHTQTPAPDAAHDVFLGLQRRLKGRLDSRASAFVDHIEATDGRYFADVATGGVDPELERVVRTFKPDLLVFGRHHALRTKPFNIGRLPFRAMLSYGKPVLVVPGDGR
jgi:nucleotide-binding universal stress UspA family protein